MNEQVSDLLRQAASEIRILRNENNHLKETLNLYESLNILMRNVPLSGQSGMMHPDVVNELLDAAKKLEESKIPAQQ